MPIRQKHRQGDQEGHGQTIDTFDNLNDSMRVVVSVFSASIS